MSNLLREALASLTEEFKQFVSDTITYSDGSGYVDVQGTVGRKLMRIDTELGPQVEWTDLDVIIPTADLVINGQRIEPKRGHKIFVTVADQVQTYDVEPMGNDQPFVWADPMGHTSMRVHCKLLNVEGIYGYGS